MYSLYNGGEKMWYLIGLIPGVITGVVTVWSYYTSTKYSVKDMNINENITIFRLWVKRIMVFGAFIVSTFLVGPSLFYMYSFRFAQEGKGALWSWALSMTLFALIASIANVLQNTKVWKTTLISYLIFTFAFGWLIPLLYNWFAV